MAKTSFDDSQAQRLLAAVKRKLNSPDVAEEILPAGEAVASLAKRLVRLGKGPDHLRDSIVAKVADPRPGDKGPLVIVRAESPEAHLVEYGHGGPMPAAARPFMRPAASGGKSIVRHMIETTVRKLVVQAWRR